MLDPTQPHRCGVVLVRWLRQQGREEQAVHAAYRLGLIDDEDLEAAWTWGTDVLAGVR